MKVIEIVQISVVGALVIGGAWLAIARFTGSDTQDQRVEVVVPELSAVATQGQRLYAANCASCHGENGVGTEQGPPLVHDIYNPGHHADEAFYRAVANGVPAHHWRFGDMPPRPDVSRRDVTAIIRYVRELQVANGIGFREHRM